MSWKLIPFHFFDNLPFSGAQGLMKKLAFDLLLPSLTDNCLVERKFLKTAMVNYEKMMRCVLMGFLWMVI